MPRAVRRHQLHVPRPAGQRDRCSGAGLPLTTYRKFHADLSKRFTGKFKINDRGEDVMIEQCHVYPHPSAAMCPTSVPKAARARSRWRSRLTRLQHGGLVRVPGDDPEQRPQRCRPAWNGSGPTGHRRRHDQAARFRCDAGATDSANRYDTVHGGPLELYDTPLISNRTLLRARRSLKRPHRP